MVVPLESEGAPAGEERRVKLRHAARQKKDGTGKSGPGEEEK